MKTHLFYTFLVIFIATAVVTLLGVTSVIAIREGYLTALVGAFLIELGGAVIAIFKGADFFSSEKNQVTAEEDIRKSIRKLDTAIGYLSDRQTAQEMHIQPQLLASRHLAPTPRTDIMALSLQITANVGKVHPNVIEEALGAIADVLEAKVPIGSAEKSTLVSLCKSLPAEMAGPSSRVLHALERKDA